MDNKDASALNGPRGSSMNEPYSNSGSLTNSNTSWWRWSYGKSGSISSSSDNPTGHNGSPSSLRACSSNPNEPAVAGHSPPSDGYRWQKRASRSTVAASAGAASGASNDDNAASLLWSSSPFIGNSSISSGSPKFATGTIGPPRSSYNSKKTRRGIESKSKRKTAVAATSAPLFATASASSSSSSSSAESHPVGTNQPVFAEITWSVGSCIRKVNRRDKKSARTPLQGERRSRYLQRSGRDVTGVHASGSEGVAVTPSSCVQMDEPMDMSVAYAPQAAVHQDHQQRQQNPMELAIQMKAEEKTPIPQRSTDPLVNCARAVLQDCIRKRCLEHSNARKRRIEAMAKSETSSPPLKGSPDSGGFTWCSSSSDDELSQLSSMEPTLDWIDKRDDGDSKHWQEPHRRDLLIRDNSDFGSGQSSPDLDGFGPFFEEKGLPVEIRYQLPLALGTANEIEKECTICQLCYGIGDHIVTLPCQHYFHACCVDKWLWNHVSCPLCRKEVTLDSASGQMPSPKHKFNECPPVDQETMRRKMRSSSQSNGFRPVVPANVEADQLHSHLANLSLHKDDESMETNQLTYLVCPTPQRTQTN